MRYFIIALILAIAPTGVFAEVNIFACEPEWGSLAQEIGGDKVVVNTATTARQDAHYVNAKPSLLASMRKADLVFCSGASLEIGWLPVLLQKAGKPEVQPRTKGLLYAADYVHKLEVPSESGIKLDRSQGDVHPEGNPHIHLNPHNISVVAKELTSRLAVIDSANADYYRKNLDNFSTKWEAAIKEWEAKAKSLKRVNVVVHHVNSAYLIDWLGMNKVASLEPKPGIPPTASHLESLLSLLEKTKAKMILRAPFEDEEPSQWLAEKTGTKAVMLPYTVGGDAEAKDFYSLFDRTINLLLEASK